LPRKNLPPQKALPFNPRHHSKKKVPEAQAFLFLGNIQHIAYGCKEFLEFSTTGYECCGCHLHKRPRREL
jgi:hypothetical protein